MKFTAREIIGNWEKAGINLAGIERALDLPFGTLKPLHETEGPAPPELEILLNIVNSVPSLIAVAEENFRLSKVVENLFEKWKEQQREILKLLEK